MAFPKSTRERLLARDEKAQEGPAADGLRWEQFSGIGEKARVVPWGNVTSTDFEGFLRDLVNEDSRDVDVDVELKDHTHPVGDIEVGNASERMVIQMEGGKAVWQYLKLHT